ncbi:MAG: general secretion pathway protein GspC [Labilithrix sp.]|nr:general secretion pathway protein GspC [Labilithrix sp.]
MRIARALVAAAVPAAVVVAALLNAQAIGALVEATLSADAIAPVARAQAPIPASNERPPADAILDRNPFDHAAGPLRGGPEKPSDGRAKTCEGVRPLVVVGADDPEIAFAALDVGGKRVLRRRGGEVLGMRVAHVGRDAVVFEMADGYCSARLFGPPPTSAPRDIARAATDRSAFDVEIASKIVKSGTSEYTIDRATLDRILEAQTELMKAKVVPEKEGGRVVGVRVYGVRPGSVLSMLGIENGDRLETLNGWEMGDPEKMLEAYARLRAGADMLSIRLTRRGAPMTLDYVIR